MGLLDRLFGRRPQQHAAPYGDQGYADRAPGRYARQPDGQPLPDEQAVARYRYLLRTAPPEQIEQAHAEAFAQLTTDQRQQVLAQLAAVTPAAERPRTDDVGTLARVATRAEMRQPGTLERALGGYGPGYGAQPGYGGGYGGRPGYGYGGGMGMGGMIGGSLLGTIGGLVIGTAVADALFDTGLGDGGLFGGGDEEAYAQGYEDGADSGDYGDAGGDYGGGDYGGGDFGGGDFGGGDF
jgi:hypothetical protein